MVEVGLFDGEVGTVVQRGCVIFELGVVVLSLEWLAVLVVPLTGRDVVRLGDV